MTKADWGAKRTCSNCGARFYDMMRAPIVCPKCEHVLESETVPRSRRSSAPPPAPKPVPIPVVVKAKPKPEPEEVEPAEAGAEGEGPPEAQAEEEVIEDASDLGEDDDDMAEVMEHLDEDLDEEP